MITELIVSAVDAIDPNRSGSKTFQINVLRKCPECGKDLEIVEHMRSRGRYWLECPDNHKLR